MPTQDKGHFDRYTDQNQVKHRILTSYLPAYLTALKASVSRFHYIDGFAGPGYYERRYPGSPLLVIDKLIDAKVSDRATVSCVEADPQFFRTLEETLAEYPGSAQLFSMPLVRQGRFQDNIDEILSCGVYSTPRRGQDVATFAFVDPCGLLGVRLADIVRLLQLPYGECLLFFNYTGVIRLIGGVQAGSHSESVLLELLGTQARVNALLQALAKEGDREKEVLVRDHFTSAVKEDAGAEFFVPFAVQAPAGNRTSHYLIHCSRNDLAFKIMKDVMYTASNDQSDDYGRLTYLSVEELGQQLSFFARQDIEEQKRQILSCLAEGPRRVRYFCDAWVRRSHDPFSSKHYKIMLLDLESAGQINVFSKDGSEPCPPESRPKYKGKVTMGDDYWVRMARN